MFDLKKLVVILFIFIFSSGMVYAANETNVDSSNPNLVNDDLLKTDIDDSSLCDGNISQYGQLQKLIDDAGEGDVIVLDKNYTFDVNYDSHVSIMVNKSITIDGNGFTLNSLKQFNILEVSADNVVLKNINFINGMNPYYPGGAVVWQGVNGTLTSCNFSDCTGSGGSAVNWDAPNGTISNCIFSNNGLDYGCGALCLNDGFISVFNCQFIANYAPRGGALYTTSNSFNCSVKGCLFKNNNATDDMGGAVMVDDGTSNLTIADCNFTNNNVFSGNGGAIFAFCFNDLSIIDCIFKDNLAADKGGAVYSSIGDNLTISGCRFINNSAYYAGAFYNYASWNSNVSDCFFENNSQEIQSSIKIQDSNNFTLIRCTVSSTDGIYMMDSSAFLEKNNISGSIYNEGGEILSEVFIVVLQNSTKKGYVGQNTIITACIMDDNKNILSYDNLQLFLIFSNSTALATHLNDDVWYAQYKFNTPGKYVISANSSELSNAVVLPGVLHIAKEADLKISIDSLITYGDDLLINITAPADATGDLLVFVDGKLLLNTTVNSTVISISNITAGNHSVCLNYTGDDTYFSNSLSQNFTVLKSDTVLSGSVNVKRLVCDYSAGERGSMVYVTLKSKNGNALAGKKISVKINKSSCVLITDKNGRCGFQINLAGGGKYVIKFSFTGDENYNAAVDVNTGLSVLKKKTAISAKSKTFKAKTKIKKLKVKLNTVKNPYNGKKYLKAGKKLILKIKNKKFAAKINKKGVAIFKIKFNRKGKFNAVIKFKGDKTYRGSVKKIKIKIK